MKTIIVSVFNPSEHGHGGNHRSYQVLHDFQSRFGKNNIVHLAYKDWLQSKGKKSLKNRIQELPFFTKRMLKYWVSNPYRILGKTRFSTEAGTYYGFLEYYRSHVRTFSPDLCIIEHPGLAVIVKENLHRGIPTIAMPQNLESMDTGSYNSANAKWHLLSRMSDFMDEVNLYQECSSVYMLSRIENGILRELGLASYYYPNKPVGLIYDYLMTIRRQRQETQRQEELVLLMGSASHKTTREGFLWIIDQARKYGVPKNIKIVIVGIETNNLIPANEHIEGIECLGWIEQAQLDTFLTRAKCVLVPHFRGNGSLTRLPEMSCAGIPVITTFHTVNSIDALPGVWIAEDHWESWIEKIMKIGNTDGSTFEDYEKWSNEQSFPDIRL